MEYVELALSLKNTIEDLLAGNDRIFSEYSFANLYLFRGEHQYRFHGGQHVHVSGLTYDGCRHALPLRPLDEDYVRCLLAGHDAIYPVGERELDLIGSFAAHFECNDADSDYLFRARSLAHLQGAKLRRSQARQFDESHRPAMVAIDWQTMPIVREVLQGWLGDVGPEGGQRDLGPCLEALELMDELGLEGRVAITSSGQGAAFLIDGPGPCGSRIFHFAKGRREFPGSYAWLFARRAGECGDCIVNMEQDLGSPGLAQSKRAFAPFEVRRKYRLGVLR